MLSLFSLSIGLGLVEGTYRVKLYRSLQRRPSNPVLPVTSHSVYAYDPDYGYRYIPNAAQVVVGIQHGRVLFCWHGSVNDEGNIGRMTASWSPNDLKILVVGDSFSAMPAGPEGSITWTDFLPALLSEAVGRHVSVKNYARDGYGILQMFHLALGMARIYNPDLIIVSFITDDLTRSRFYRSTTTIGGEERVLTFFTPGHPPDVRSTKDMILLNPKVTTAWCHLPPPEQADVLREIDSQYTRLARDRRSLGLTTMRKSFVYERIVYGDPFSSAFKFSRDRHIAYHDYRDDHLFMADIKGLSALDIPVNLVHIPVMEELQAGRYMLDAKHAHLLQSLEQVTNREITRLLPLVTPRAHVEELFLVPYDRHPNTRGATFYAQLIANHLTRHLPALRLTNGRSRPPAASAAVQR